MFRFYVTIGANLSSYYWAGTKAYDALAKISGEGIESSYFLTRGKALEAFPMLKAQGLCGALVYYGILKDQTRDYMY